MSLAQEIKNYLHFLQNFVEQPNDLPSLILYLKYNLIYILNLLKDTLFFIFSFGWVHDFVELPSLLPVYNNSILREIYTTQNPSQFLLDYKPEFTPIVSSWNTLFFHAFFTSFYYWFPNSIIQFLILRRLIVEGIPAGLFAALGTLTAQILFIITLLFGFRASLFPWLTLEPWNYAIGLIFICILIYNLSHSSLKRRRFSHYLALSQIFFINFTLVAFENYGLFPYFDSFSLVDNLNFLSLVQLQQKFIYIFAFSISSCFWITLFGYIFLSISQFIVNKVTKSYSNWIQKVNFGCLTLILSYCIASIPYYGLDYIFLSPFGLYSEEQSPFTLQTNKKDVPKGRLGEYSAHSSIDTDVTPYDRGRYSTGSEIELTFEDLNFQGEYIWRARTDRLASGSAGIVNKFMSKFLPKSNKDLPPVSKSLERITTEPIQMQSIYTNNSIFENLFNRFLSDYTAEVKDITLPDSPLEYEQFSAFSELVKYGFDSFASLEDIESDEFEEELGKKIKYKYYNNPIYKFIVRLDMTHFLKRQPKKYYLTEKEENQLFKQKQILMNYYNSLRDYSLLPYTKIFKDLFSDTKSYANRVYNQQYKGTLKILRRLFLIELQPKNAQTVLKYDQILLDQQKPLTTSFHEEIETKEKRTKKRLKYIREISNRPFYLGWDNKNKQLMISNRYLNHENLFQAFKYGEQDKTKMNIYFTSWPYLSNPSDIQTSQFMFQKFEQAQTDLQKDLFEYTEIGDYESHLIYETLPSIIKRIDLRNKDKALIVLKPTYGVSIDTNCAKKRG